MIKTKADFTQEEVDRYCESVPFDFNGRCKRKPIHGVGINDLPHQTKLTDENGKTRRHSGYRLWNSILDRGYSENFKLKSPTYTDVTVCKEWFLASNFVTWCKMQRKDDGWQLDKDLLVIGNRVYSPETCLFVPPWLNTFTATQKKRRGDYLIGTSWHKPSKKYITHCCNPLTGEQEHLGLFTSEIEAHLVWRKRKLEHALTLKPKMDEIDIRIYPNVVEIISTAK